MIAFPGSENIKEVDHVLGCENRELSKKDALGRVQEQKNNSKELWLGVFARGGESI